MIRRIIPFKKMPAGSHNTDSLPIDLGSQNEWIKSKFKEWRHIWHELFDEDKTLRDLGEFERNDQPANDIDTDYRLIFGFSQAEAETRKKCFELFPNGAEMHRRFESYLTGKQDEMTEPEALELINQIISLIDHDALKNCDRISDLFESSVLEPRSQSELQAVAARLFLTEPLYAAAGNSYELRDWVAAAMLDDDRDKVYELIYQLWRSGWQPLPESDGIVLART